MGKRKKISFFITVYVCALTVFAGAPLAKAMQGDALAAACLKSGLPSVSFDKEEGVSRTSKPTKPENSNVEVTKGKRVKGKPLVLIYHTHATESYLPSWQGNYHTVKEENTVRQVGDSLKKSLEEEGVAVVHDKTIHDNPSYDSSYERSHETAAALLKKYPSIVCVIDLHRDAISSDYEGDTVTVNGRKCATYSYVVGTAAPTYDSNNSFVALLNQTAAKKYDGFTGRVMYREYIYNQELSEKCILLEVGNNRNNIDDVENSAEILGKIIADSV